MKARQSCPWLRAPSRMSSPARPQTQPVITGARTLDCSAQKECCWWHPCVIKSHKPDSAALSREGDAALFPEHTVNMSTNTHIQEKMLDVIAWAETAEKRKINYLIKPFLLSFGRYTSKHFLRGCAENDYRNASACGVTGLKLISLQI